MAKTTTTKNLSMPATPSSILTDALSSFTKAANTALATAEDQARAEIARANAEAKEARRERDESLQELHTIRLQEKEWQRRVDGWKSSIEKSEITINHQNETIAQLREESQQWKNQLLRFENASRQEIQDWKEQYLRAEQERCRLSARIDGFMAEELMFNTHLNAHNEIAELTSFEEPGEVTVKRGSTASLPQRSGYPDANLSQTSLRKSKALSNKTVSGGERARTEMIPHPPTPSRNGAVVPTRTPRQKAATEIPSNPTPSRSAAAPRTSMSQPRTQLIRRVQAVIEVPVKEEDDGGEAFMSDVSTGFMYDPDGAKKAATSKSVPKTKAKRRSSIKGKKPAANGDDDYEESGEDEEEAVHQSLTATHSRRRIVDEDDDDDDDDEDDEDEDDELIIGAEDKHREVYVSQRAKGASEVKTPSRQKSVNNSKKRKLDADATSSRGGKVARKKVQ